MQMYIHALLNYQKKKKIHLADSVDSTKSQCMNKIFKAKLAVHPHAKSKPVLFSHMEILLAFWLCG